MKNEHFRLYPPELLVLKSSSIRQMVFFRRTFPENNYTLIIRPLCIDRDVPVIFQWMYDPIIFNLQQPGGTREELSHHYAEFMESGNGYSLVVFMKSRLVAQVDFFHVSSDQIKDHYAAKDGDHGINVLMSPNQKVAPKLSANILITGLAYLFTLSVDRVMVYPDAGNEIANDILTRAGFKFMKQVQLTGKKANLYYFDREEFLKHYS